MKNTENKLNCLSCNIPWENHPGIALVCAENKKLRKTIKQASAEFFKEGSDGQIAARMLDILNDNQPWLQKTLNDAKEAAKKWPEWAKKK